MEMSLLIYSLVAVLLGFLLDILLGDPRGFPHIICAIGNLISFMEKRLRKRCNCERDEIIAGRWLVIIVLCISTFIPAGILVAAYIVSPWLYVAISAFICYQLLATKGLKQESMKVQYALQSQGLEEARFAVSMIVGRDTASLDEEAVTRAAVETVAENTSDGSVAPLFYMMLGGAILGCFYKAVNTMDSMVGYKNDKYLNFGRCAAKLDDVLNYIPARLSACLMIISAWLLNFDARNALRIYKRDKRNHASPNSAHTESVCAGALGIQLAGDTYYFGKLYKKPTIGDATRSIESADIEGANKLLYITSFLMVLVVTLVYVAILGVIGVL